MLRTLNPSRKSKPPARWLAWLWVGARASDPLGRARKILQVNVTALLGLLAACAYTVINLVLGLDPLLHLAVGEWMLAALLPLVWWLNSQRLILAARGLLIFVLMAMTLTAVLTGLGAQLDAHFYFALCAAMAPMLFETHQLRLAVLLAVVNIALAVGFELHPATDTAVANLDPALLTALRMGTRVGCVFMIVALVGINEWAAARSEAKLARIAVTDTLTGLPNRGQVERLYRVALEQLAERHWQVGPGARLSVGLLDLDHFKAVNDTLGHAAGDAALRHMGALLTRALGEHGDHVARLGGEEFVLLMVRDSTQAANEGWETLRKTLAAAPFEYRGCPWSLTASIGILHVNDGRQAIEVLLKSADAALYRAKRDGRNRVCEAEPITTTFAAGLDGDAPRRQFCASRFAETVI